MERDNQSPTQLTDPPNEQTPSESESPYEMYGWEFHKKPLLYALILTVLFYAFIFFFINI